MHAVLLSIWLLAPCEAQRPAQTADFVKVDFIVINRHRQVREWEETNWEHQPVVRREFTENWWVSFWDVLVVDVPRFGPVFYELVDRGWWRFDQIELISPCSDGFMVQAKSADGKPGLTVLAGEVHLIDSPFDWEVRNRRIYDPIRRP